MIFFFSIIIILIITFIIINIKILFYEIFPIKKIFFAVAFIYENNVFTYTIIIIFICVIFFLKFYIKKSKVFRYFYFFLFWFILSIIILINRNSFVILFIGWEGLGIRSFMLINFYKNWARINNSLITLFNNKIGDFILLILISIYIFEYSMTFIIYTNSIILFYIILTKRAQIPFICWLPAAISAPTPISALVHSSTLVTAGILLLRKFLYVLTYKIHIFMFLISVISLLLSRVFAINEKDFKKIIAYSTLRHIRIILIIFSLSLSFLAFFHLFIHAFFKSLLFFSVGNVLHNNNNYQDGRKYFKILHSRYFNYRVIIITLLSIRGLLFFSGFFRKERILENIFYIKKNHILFLLLFIIRLTISYSFKIFLVFFNINKYSTMRCETSQRFFLVALLSFMFRILLGHFLLHNIIFFSEKFLFKENFLLFFIIVFFILNMYTIFYIFNTYVFFINILITINKNIYLKKFLFCLERNSFLKVFYFLCKILHGEKIYFIQLEYIYVIIIIIIIIL